jgi:hypothetical protein
MARPPILAIDVPAVSASPASPLTIMASNF